ncbi:hypothetical protein [Listeria booriae]|uniref:Uncharacterized protein n=1 Tax=Listeria booriae TaxID=1552123 RepID=A0A7X0XN81_9LIST|nr:hypothetical protein [Listeria booriae]MBC1563601.1 hypothetical protein [Listeria booriae]
MRSETIDAKEARDLHDRAIAVFMAEEMDSFVANVMPDCYMAISEETKKHRSKLRINVSFEFLAGIRPDNLPVAQLRYFMTQALIEELESMDFEVKKARFRWFFGKLRFRWRYMITLNIYW